MDHDRAPAAGCILAAVVTTAVVLLPYALARPGTVALYYGPSAAGPPLAGLFAVLTAITVAAAATERTDPPAAAGAGVALGIVAAGIAWTWAPSVVLSTAASVSPADAFRHHRWLVAAAATGVAAGAGWYAAAVLR